VHAGRCAAIAPRRLLATALSLVGIAQRITCSIFIGNGRLDRIMTCGLREVMGGPIS
jgi:hypothetical protein